MTTDITAAQELQEELANMYERAAGPISAADFHTEQPKGTVLAEAELQYGSKIQITQGDTLVSLNGVPLPGRTRVYDTISGVTSDVPTAQLAYQLSKRRQDGSRVYSLRLPPGIVMPTPIEDTCQICYKARGNKHRNFYSEEQLINHMQAFHERGWGLAVIWGNKPTMEQAQVALADARHAVKHAWAAR